MVLLCKYWEWELFRLMRFVDGSMHEIRLAVETGAMPLPLSASHTLPLASPSTLPQSWERTCTSVCLMFELK